MTQQEAGTPHGTAAKLVFDNSEILAFFKDCWRPNNFLVNQTAKTGVAEDHIFLDPVKVCAHMKICHSNTQSSFGAVVPQDRHVCTGHQALPRLQADSSEAVLQLF
jgi:hypothetical protein